jgi:hypothetical protein
VTSSIAEQELLALYSLTTPPIRRRGRAWYPEANRRLRRIAHENGRPLSQAVAVFSIVSPASQLETSLRWTDLILKGELKGGRFPNVQAPKIDAALATRYPARHVSGPKVQPFYRAIMGDTNALVLDRWAAFAGGWPRDKHAIPRWVLTELDTAYRSAAQLVGETVRAFQAILWILVRETTPKSNGVVPRLTDITT